MAEYKDIHGTTIRNSAGNLAGAKTGELFFDSTNLDFKYQFPNVTPAGSWRTGGNLNTGRANSAGAAANSTAALVSGGAPNVAITESWNGSSWTEVNDLNTGRDYLAGTGTSTSALDWGGHPSVAITESWNGSNWTEVADLNQARGQLAGCGISNTSALAFGGNSPLTGETES